MNDSKLEFEKHPDYSRQKNRRFVPVERPETQTEVQTHEVPTQRTQVQKMPSAPVQKMEMGGEQQTLGIGASNSVIDVPQTINPAPNQPRKPLLNRDALKQLMQGK